MAPVAVVAAINVLSSLIAARQDDEPVVVAAAPTATATPAAAAAPTATQDGFTFGRPGATGSAVPDGGAGAAGEGDEFSWYSKTGILIKWAILIGIVLIVVLYIILGRMHARLRIDKGLAPLRYHRVGQSPNQNPPHPQTLPLCKLTTHPLPSG
jgi:hypothetical protein